MIAFYKMSGLKDMIIMKNLENKIKMKSHTKRFLFTTLDMCSERP